MTKILVIEDEAILRANTIQILEFEDFQTIEAENGLIGVQLAQKELPDLIICDIMMRGIDGYTVLAMLRQNPLTATIPFIFTTAKASKSDLRRGMELGADDYLTKPFTADELLNAIATRLEKQATIIQQYTTKLKQVEEKLNYLVHYDSLTNLPNQLLLQDRLNALLTQANNHKIIVPILLLGLAQFEQINSTLGHEIGNLLLKAVAERLIACLGKESMVARLHTEQFAIALPSVKLQEFTNIAQSILDSLSKSFILNKHEVFITTNIGIALYPVDGKDINTLIENAKVAMQFSKKKEVNSYQFYTSKMNAYLSKQIALDNSLHHALEREEFQVYYQPQVDLRTGKIVGAEALLRWQHPEQGLVSPVKFIPIAEENGLIVPIGEWILMAACRQTKIWQTNCLPNLRISVNLSARQFGQHNLSQRLVHILEETGLEPKYLELELTESIFIKNTEATTRMLNELQTLGVEIAIDDFGTGYSSLSYLKQFPVDTIKIDKCFVDSVVTDSKTAKIVTAIIQMAHDLNMKTIAEGVETKAEFSFLRQRQCDEFQGYFFSRPLTATEFEQLLNRENYCKSYIRE
ncbi:EAL domain-containing response regulator [Gloeocapsopsis dulcis]|uniref:GGDEF domain-containing response regulator n=1 Tax=Gloeocapsopsis dulcis AAB1 = 1H9 TaxID=1433147 RepID=A0A6N8G0S1_9CHRO|nr:GGDEF domain-containing response regulator [Gloeocapsopsis dulcis]MUL38594.1 GGDEF domain-containing response regulator [Gloeocapsopsis dulcis AAB1 = 1H9]WNN91154.1 EAL domain-containing protein [Gloeocapsopsis dulcis]